MFVGLGRARRLLARGLAWSLTAAAVVLSPVAVGALDPTLAVAAPMDCAPVGVERIDGVLYYVENCFGYDVYRVLE